MYVPKKPRPQKTPSPKNPSPKNQTEVPEQLYKKALHLVKEGWFHDEKDIFYEAIRRYLDTHTPDMMEKFIRDDVEWGLHGDD